MRTTEQRAPLSERPVEPLAPARADAGRRWTAAFVVWTALALLALWPVAASLDAAFPIFTVVWIGVPLVAVFRSNDAADAGFHPVPWQLLLQTTAIDLGLSFALMLALEPWSHAYERLIDLATSAEPLDTTFAWLVRYPRPEALAAMAAYSGLVTMFAEELFFRGWLLQALRRRLGTTRAIVTQAALFMLPNALAATVMAPVEGAVYVLGYAFLTVGVVGGWAAARTGSIWPSLITVTISNLVFVGLLA